MTVPIPVQLRSNNMADLAYPDIQAYLKVCDLVLVPIASTEQHGPHLPLSTDTVTATQVASRVAKINNMIHTPAIWTGYSPQHMRETESAQVGQKKKPPHRTVESQREVEKPRDEEEVKRVDLDDRRLRPPEHRPCRRA